MIIVDTNVVSELMKPSPYPGVQNWIRARHGSRLHTTSITVAEIRYGIERLPAGRREDVLVTTADKVFAAFSDQILPFDAAAAIRYSVIVAARDRSGEPIDGFDAQIAAMCRTHGATLATRNLKDFYLTGIELADPWQRQ
ncbi:MAG: type II toxin-antitoxin system VapC family toxin [Mycobacteriales bacterium]